MESHEAFCHLQKFIGRKNADLYFPQKKGKRHGIWERQIFRKKRTTYLVVWLSDAKEKKYWQGIS